MIFCAYTTNSALKSRLDWLNGLPMLSETFDEIYATPNQNLYNDAASAWF